MSLCLQGWLTETDLESFKEVWIRFFDPKGTAFIPMHKVLQAWKIIMISYTSFVYFKTWKMLHLRHEKNMTWKEYGMKRIWHEKNIAWKKYGVKRIWHEKNKASKEIMHTHAFCVVRTCVTTCMCMCLCLMYIRMCVYI